MSLDRLSREGRLRITPTSKREIADLFGAAKRYLDDARIDQVSLDGRYCSAYTAVLQVATALLRCHEYRAAGPGHHATTFEALSIILGSPHRGLVSYFHTCRSKRNRAQYHRVGLVSERDLADLIGETERFLALGREWIADQFPEYSPDP